MHSRRSRSHDVPNMQGGQCARLAMAYLARRMVILSAMREIVVAMKRPKCMEKRILDDVPVTNICPKCGSEMTIHHFGGIQGNYYDYWECRCGYEIDLADCGNESKLEGENP